MAELTRLLGFMSSWDRQAALEKYEARFASCRDADALIEELGTPTKLAIELAQRYVPTPPPAAPSAAETEPAEAEPAALPEAAPARCPEPETEPAAPVGFEHPEPAETPAAETGRSARRIKGGALALYLLPAVVIGLPVTVLLVCVGLPFLAAGAGTVAGAIFVAWRAIGALSLVSDILLTAGAGIGLCGLGVLLCWLGLWISLTLAHLWLTRVLFALGERFCVKKEADAV